MTPARLKQTKFTRKLQQTLDFLKGYDSEHGFSPSIREMCDALDLASSSTGHARLRDLEALNKIQRRPNQPRSIHIVGHVSAGPTPLSLLNECIQALGPDHPLSIRIELVLGGLHP